MLTVVSLDIVQIIKQGLSTEGSSISCYSLVDVVTMLERIVSYNPHVKDSVTELLRNKKLFVILEKDITADYIRSIRRYVYNSPSIITF